MAGPAPLRIASERDRGTCLSEARNLTDDLFRLVRQEALYDRPIAERHRLIFYIGHLETFDWNLICRDVLGRDSFHEEFDRLFAFGIDPTGGKLPDDRPSDWPSLAEVESYNQRVRREVDGGLRDTRLGDGQLFHVALEHRLMHAETLAYLLHQLPPGRKVSTETGPLRAVPPVSPRMVEIPEGTATLGLPRNGGFGWDNEFELHSVPVPAFSIDANNVTNGQYLEFLRAGGYEEQSLWTEAGWLWKTAREISHPSFWTERRGWLYRTMFGEVPLPHDWPVYVSHAEAAAYARWKGKALPAEGQFHRAAYGVPNGFEREYPWGSQSPDAIDGNFDFRRWDPVPVGSCAAGNSAFGVTDLVGNGWEWTSTIFEAFPGFERFRFYPGYSADFFDGRHYVAKGGSPRTAACLLRRSFRNWFQPHYPYVYATFRCVEN